MNIYSLLGLTSLKNVKCYPTMTKERNAKPLSSLRSKIWLNASLHGQSLPQFGWGDLGEGGLGVLKEFGGWGGGWGGGGGGGNDGIGTTSCYMVI